MDCIKYECVDCKTIRYLIFPNMNESFIICSACYYERCEKDEETEKRYKK